MPGASVVDSVSDDDDDDDIVVHDEVAVESCEDVVMSGDDIKDDGVSDSVVDVDVGMVLVQFDSKRVAAQLNSFVNEVFAFISHPIIESMLVKINCVYDDIESSIVLKIEILCIIIN